MRFAKQLSWKISQNSQENTCTGVCFLLQRESGTCVFLSTSQNFSEQLFNGYQWNSHLEKFRKTNVLQNFAKFIGKHLYQNHFCIKIHSGTALNSTKLFRTFYRYHRSSHLVVFRKRDALKNFAKFIEKDLCRSLFLITKRLQLSCFHLSFAKSFRETF